jgi:hypothetical protein
MSRDDVSDEPLFLLQYYTYRRGINADAHGLVYHPPLPNTCIPYGAIKLIPDHP